MSVFRWVVPVGLVFRLLWLVLEAMEYLLEVPQHVNFNMFLGVISCNVDSAKACALPIDGDVFVVTSQGVEEVVGIRLACALDSKIVDHQGELEESRVVFPESGCVFCLVEPIRFETLCEELVGKDYGLW